MNLPNKLTVFRIFLIPLFILLLVFNFPTGSFTVMNSMIPWAHFWAAIVFIVASLTDLLDGKIARKYHLVSNFGKFADPLADKMLVMTAFIFLVELGKAPAWIVSIIVCRELAVTGLRLLIVEGNGEVLAAAMPGKIKTTTQMLSIIFLLMNDIFFSALSIPMGTILLYICLFFTIYSGADYFIQNKAIFSDTFKK